MKQIHVAIQRLLSQAGSPALPKRGAPYACSRNDPEGWFCLSVGKEGYLSQSRGLEQVLRGAAALVDLAGKLQAEDGGVDLVPHLGGRERWVRQLLFYFTLYFMFYFTL